MRTKKTTNKKSATRKTTAKTGTKSIKLLSATGKTTKRPPNNPDVPQTTIDLLNHTLNDLKATLDDYSQHLRAGVLLRIGAVC
jgi:hypothetical protein